MLDFVVFLFICISFVFCYRILTTGEQTEDARCPCEREEARAPHASQVRHHRLIHPPQRVLQLDPDRCDGEQRERDHHQQQARGWRVCERVLKTLEDSQ